VCATMRCLKLEALQENEGLHLVQMHPEMERTLRNLGVVSQLEQHDKLVTEGDFFAIYAPSAARAVLRYWYGEARDQNMTRVANCVQLAKMIVTQIVSEHARTDGVNEHVSVSYRLLRREQIAACGRLLKSLKQCVSGLDNLIMTYRADTSTVVRIQQIKQNVADFLESTESVTQLSLTHRMNDN
jgi:hypothetical protein